MWLQKFSIVSVIVIHNIIYVSGYNYCRVNKSRKGIIFYLAIYLYLCHMLL